MIQISPNDATSNFSKWLEFFGVNVPDFLTFKSVDPWMTVIFIILALLGIVWEFWPEKKSNFQSEILEKNNPMERPLSITIGAGENFESSENHSKGLWHKVYVAIENSSSSFQTNCQLFCELYNKDGILRNHLLKDDILIPPNGKSFIEIASFSDWKEGEFSILLSASGHCSFADYDQLLSAKKRNPITLILRKNGQPVFEVVCILEIENNKLRLVKA